MTPCFNKKAFRPLDRENYTCNNCSLVCHLDKETRKHRYNLLTQSGVVLQHPDGTLEALSPEEAAMPPEHRALYETI